MIFNFEKTDKINSEKTDKINIYHLKMAYLCDKNYGKFLKTKYKHTIQESGLLWVKHGVKIGKGPHRWFSVLAML